jgi:hypothetical protein
LKITAPGGQRYAAGLRALADAGAAGLLHVRHLIPNTRPALCLVITRRVAWHLRLVGGVARMVHLVVEEPRRGGVPIKRQCSFRSEGASIGLSNEFDGPRELEPAKRPTAMRAIPAESGAAAGRCSRAANW